jgi:hypothetical protein
MPTIDGIDLDLVLTDAQFATFYGGATRLQAYLTRDAIVDGAASSEDARIEGLRQVMALLASRTPPIRGADLGDPAELRHVVTLAAAAHVHFQAMTSGAPDDVDRVKYEALTERMTEAMDALNLTVSGGARGPYGGTITTERR